MILPIIKYGSSVLRNKSGNIQSSDPVEMLVNNMFETLKKADGIGLAAPQVNLLKNLFIIDTTPFEDESMPKIEKAYFNPEIIHYGENFSDYDEGCLSIPCIFENVKRPSEIEVRYYNTHFDLIEEKLDGIAARIFQHEYDHLQGVLFIDRMNSLRRKMIHKKLQRLSNTGKS